MTALMCKECSYLRCKRILFFDPSTELVTLAQRTRRRASGSGMAVSHTREDEWVSRQEPLGSTELRG
jgi:hypothetical protein